MTILPGPDWSTRAPRMILICALLGTPIIIYALRASRPGDHVVTVNGNVVAMERGSAWAYLTLRDGVPIELGVALNPRAESEPPEGRGLRGPVSWENALFRYELRLPGQNPTPYRHVVVDWRPQSAGLLAGQDQPLLALRFYTITDAERRRIDPADPAFERRATRPVSSELVPRRYVMSGAALTPQSGVLWIDPDAVPPEDSFRCAVLYGSWDGRLIMTEVVVAASLLDGKADCSAWLAPSARHDPSGYYPTSLRIRWDARQYVHRIALAEFASSN